jgi:hypothetical protein
VIVCHGRGASFRLKSGGGVFVLQLGEDMSDEFGSEIKKRHEILSNFEKEIVDLTFKYLPSIGAPEMAFVLFQVTTMLVVHTCVERKKALVFIERCIQESVRIYDEADQNTEVDIEE